MENPREPNRASHGDGPYPLGAAWQSIARPMSERRWTRLAVAVRHLEHVGVEGMDLPTLYDIVRSRHPEVPSLEGLKALSPGPSEAIAAGTTHPNVSG